MARLLWSSHKVVKCCLVEAVETNVKRSLPMDAHGQTEAKKVNLEGCLRNVLSMESEDTEKEQCVSKEEFATTSDGDYVVAPKVRR